MSLIAALFDVTYRRSTCQLRASSRGNTEGASVNRNYWAYSACRRSVKQDVKARGSTSEQHFELAD